MTTPIQGWAAIAEAAAKALRSSVTERTARRYAEQGRDNRLPVHVYPNGRVYLTPEALALWAAAWGAAVQTGARAPVRVPRPVARVRRAVTQ